MKTINDLKLEYQEKCAISEASKVLKEHFRVQEVMLFGSKARGDDDAESDIDLLVLYSQSVSWDERKAINNALYEIQLRHDVVISTLITLSQNGMKAHFQYFQSIRKFWIKESLHEERGSQDRSHKILDGKSP